MTSETCIILVLDCHRARTTLSLEVRFAFNSGWWRSGSEMTIAALIVAGGRGIRAARAGPVPKQYLALGSSTVLGTTIARFLGLKRVDRVVCVIGADDVENFEAVVRGIGAQESAKLGAPIVGGASRQASVRLGLEALAKDPAMPEKVLIHDGVRPFVTDEVIRRVIDGLDRAAGAVPGLVSVDTLQEVDADGRLVGTVPRDRFWRVQTPQGFEFSVILSAHRAAFEAGAGPFTDDAAVALWAGQDVVMVEGGERNVKLTTEEDIALAQKLAAEKGGAMDVRTGTGFDVHRFAAGDHVWLCGIRVPHSHSLEGHSDADVGLHALTDALLGAVGAEDIGAHFPPSDPQWAGAASHIFVEAAVGRVREAGGRVTSTDITLLCEAPRIGPLRNEMRARIAALLEVDQSRVNIKATTTEGLGFVGRREGIAAMAIVTVVL